jgi:hypothetical protein
MTRTRLVRIIRIVLMIVAITAFWSQEVVFFYEQF